MAATMAMAAVAEPAHPEPCQVTNADGTTVTIKLVGDEFYHFNTTTDGYTVLRDAKGNYVYAERRDGRLVPTTVVAHDAPQRTADELALLSTLAKHMTDKQAVDGSKQARARRDTRMRAERSFDPSKFRGLVILVNFSDRKFVRGDVKNFFTRLLNEKNYSGYTNEDGSYTYYGSNFTGSVSDYFSDNTMDQFTPQFDVVGPIDVDASCMQENGTAAFSEVFKQAVTKADAQIDFSQYDNDHDGLIDLIYFIAAGFGSSYSGNNSQYLWPHAYYLWGDNVSAVDGVWPGRYACSVEFYGWESNNNYTHDGIGTICHEFSHCLGLPDLYDTDYADNGQSLHPGEWDIMAGGGHLNFSRCPAGYSLYDRYATGFANPPVITQTGDYTLNPIGTSNEGYIILTPNANEKFLLENRQRRTKWDTYLPGDGMLVARMDSTNAQVWQNNKVNCNPSHNYYELVRAGQNTSGNSSSDPFPGSKNVTTLYGNDADVPNLLTWDKQTNDFTLEQIAMNNGVISFTVGRTQPPLSVIEDFERMPLGATDNEKNVPGNFTLWSFVNSKVVAPGSELCNGEHAVEMIKPSGIEMVSPCPYKVNHISYTAHNASTLSATFSLQYSTDNGTTWTTVNNSSTTISPNSSKTVSNRVEIDEPALFRLAMSGGSKTKPVYVDDITFYYRNTFEATDYPLVVGDVQVNNFNAARVLGDGITGVVSYDPESKTLTLDGATINGTTHGIASEVDDLIINVVGENTVNSADAVGDYCIDLSKATTITGNGTLNAYGYRGVQMSGQEATMLTVGGNVTLVAEGKQIGLAGFSKVRTRILIDYYSTLKVKENATIRTVGHTSYTTIDWLDMILEDGHAITAPEGAFFDTNINRIAVPYGEYNEMVDKWVVIENPNAHPVGDVNGDNVVSGADVTALYGFLLEGKEVNGNADVSGDGIISGSDVTALYNILLAQ